MDFHLHEPSSNKVFLLFYGVCSSRQVPASENEAPEDRQHHNRSCGLTDKASDFYMISYPKIAGSSPATITSKINYGNVSIFHLSWY
ncbi:hypothetical protein OUZ56_010901 [Daphnia magna]|uniref:Uncharacterized protein n=1 Tax=Daphnia magna TaxID=35525 RepID=A0ABQ9YYW2_9CRUS|nr:hypothetical protein OUZ56_010897 [Daphnia magna]KAK4005787.1 hypothetical protein OUZ56_010901 [Daphnia magna]